LPGTTGSGVVGVCKAAAGETGGLATGSPDGATGTIGIGTAATLEGAAATDAATTPGVTVTSNTVELPSEPVEVEVDTTGAAGTGVMVTSNSVELPLEFVEVDVDMTGAGSGVRVTSNSVELPSESVDVEVDTTGTAATDVSDIEAVTFGLATEFDDTSAAVLEFAETDDDATNELEEVGT
jgi:hypothetical protein